MADDAGSNSTLSYGSTSGAVERRKAQNRASQQKYRARQKFKMEVAKAILQEGKHPDLLRFWDLKPKGGSSMDDATQFLGDLNADDSASKDNGSVKSASESLDDEFTPTGSSRSGQDSSRNSVLAPPTSISTDDRNSCIVAIADNQHELSSFQPMEESPLDLSCANSPLEDLLAGDVSFIDPNSVSRSTPVSAPLSSGSYSSTGTRLEKDPTLEYTTLAETSCHQIQPDTLTPLDHLHPPVATDSPIDMTNMDEHDNYGSQTSRSVDFTTPLLTAVSLGNLEIASLLMKHGARLDPLALDRSIERGDSAMACNLLDLGASIFTKDPNGGCTTHLHTAVEINDEDMVRALLQWCVRKDKEREREERRGVPGSLLQSVLNQARSNGMTLIHQAVFLQHSSIVRTLLEFGADVNIRVGSSNNN